MIIYNLYRIILVFSLVFYFVRDIIALAFSLRFITVTLCVSWYNNKQK